MMHFPMTRPRRLRQNQSIRDFVQQHQINTDKLVLPLFIRYGKGKAKPIASMPGHAQHTLESLDDEIKHLQQLGLKAVILFGIPETKDACGEASLNDDGLIPSAIKQIKKIAPKMIVMADTCLCEYTSHGHCGVLAEDNSFTQEIQVKNDASIDILAKQALSYAKAGADVIAPSACMDGMINAIRQTLDVHDFNDSIILSYAVKYASHLYGPFREAAEGAPQVGDRKSYQMDYHTPRDALLECELDLGEGADMLMVKPGHTYLDIIYQVKQAFPHVPLGAYHTSGEFAMLKAAAEKGLINEKLAVEEVLTAFFRAGCDFVLSYYAKEVLTWS
jgi:porphobilinogen synthase